MTDNEKALLARIDERTINILSLIETHIKDDEKKFDLFYGLVKSVDAKAEALAKENQDTLNTLWDERNQNKGSWKAIAAIAAVCSTVAVQCIEYVKNHI